MENKKGKYWFCFYATLVIVVIAVFLIVGPMIGKKKSAGGSPEPNLTIEFCTSDIDLNVRDELLFDKSIITTSVEDLDDVKFSIYDETESDNLLVEQDAGFQFIPQHAGSYKLTASYQGAQGVNDSIDINVAERADQILCYNLGDVVDVGALLKDETPTSWDDNIEQRADGFVCVRAGLAKIYTDKNCNGYRVKLCHQIAIIPNVEINDVAAENGRVRLSCEKEMGGANLGVNVYMKSGRTGQALNFNMEVVAADNKIYCERMGHDVIITFLDDSLDEFNLTINIVVEEIELKIDVTISLF